MSNYLFGLLDILWILVLQSDTAVCWSHRLDLMRSLPKLMMLWFYNIAVSIHSWIIIQTWFPLPVSIYSPSPHWVNGLKPAQSSFSSKFALSVVWFLYFMLGWATHAFSALFWTGWCSLLSQGTCWPQMQALLQSLWCWDKFSILDVALSSEIFAVGFFVCCLPGLGLFTFSSEQSSAVRSVIMGKLSDERKNLEFF